MIYCWVHTRNKKGFTAGTGLSAKFGSPKCASLAGLQMATSGPPL